MPKRKRRARLVGRLHCPYCGAMLPETMVIALQQQANQNAPEFRGADHTEVVNFDFDEYLALRSEKR